MVVIKLCATDDSSTAVVFEKIVHVRCSAGAVGNFGQCTICTVIVLCDLSGIIIHDFDRSVKLIIRATVDLLPAGAYDNLIFCDQLIERNLGILEGLPKEEAIQNYPHLFCNGKLAVTAEIPKGGKYY